MKDASVDIKIPTHSISKKIIKLDRGTLYRQTQDGNKSFEALIVPRSLIHTILINSHRDMQEQNHTALSKVNSFGKVCAKTGTFIQNCNICKHHNLQKLRNYSYIHMPPWRRPFDSIACNLVGPFHPPSSKGNSHFNMHVPLDQLPHCHIHSKQRNGDSSASIPSKYIY